MAEAEGRREAAVVPAAVSAAAALCCSGHAALVLTVKAHSARHRRSLRLVGK